MDGVGVMCQPHSTWCAVLPTNSHFVYLPSVTAKALIVWKATKICFTFATLYLFGDGWAPTAGTTGRSRSRNEYVSS